MDRSYFPLSLAIHHRVHPNGTNKQNVRQDNGLKDIPEEKGWALILQPSSNNLLDSTERWNSRWIHSEYWSLNVLSMIYKTMNDTVLIENSLQISARRKRNEETKIKRRNEEGGRFILLHLEGCRTRINLDSAWSYRPWMLPIQNKWFDRINDGLVRYGPVPTSVDHWLRLRFILHPNVMTREFKCNSFVKENVRAAPFSSHFYWPRVKDISIIN